jgi:hypothetical protein
LISSKAKFAVAGAALALFLSTRAGAQTATPAAETLYVIEHVVVSVNSAADGSGERVGQIQSGDRVEVLERQGDQARVRLDSDQGDNTEDGQEDSKEGWVRSSYLSSSPPLREQLKARAEELEKLKQEKTKLEGELASARKAVAAANATAAAAAKEAATVQAPAAPESAPSMPQPAPMTPGTPESSAPAETMPSNPPIFSGEGIVPSRPSWIAAFIVSALALGVGFALGWRVLDRRIRAKYGGLRIY